MLVLAYAEGFWVYFDEFGEGVHETSADGYGATYGHVLVGELFACRCGGGVYGGAVLGYDEDAEVVVGVEVADEGFCLAAGCAVAYGYGLDVVLVDEVSQFGLSFLGLVDWGVREYHGVAEHIALFIEAYHFTAGAEPWVEREDAVTAKWCGEEELSEVSLENFDGFCVGTLFGFGFHFGLHGWSEEAFVAVGYGGL